MKMVNFKITIKRFFLIFIIIKDTAEMEYSGPFGPTRFHLTFNSHYISLFRASYI